jgi:hypothetical protein
MSLLTSPPAKSAQHASGGPVYVTGDDLVSPRVKPLSLHNTKINCFGIEGCVYVGLMNRSKGLGYKHNVPSVRRQFSPYLFPQRDCSRRAGAARARVAKQRNKKVLGNMIVLVGVGRG